MLKAKKSEVMEKIKESTIPVKGELLSVADQLRQEGIEQGIEQKEYLTIKNMIKKGFDTDTIKDVMEVSIEYIESVRKQMEH